MRTCYAGWSAVDDRPPACAVAAKARRLVHLAVTSPEGATGLEEGMQKIAVCRALQLHPGGRC